MLDTPEPVQVKAIQFLLLSNSILQASCEYTRHWNNILAQLYRKGTYLLKILVVFSTLATFFRSQKLEIFSRELQWVGGTLAEKPNQEKSMMTKPIILLILSIVRAQAFLEMIPYPHLLRKLSISSFQFRNNHKRLRDTLVFILYPLNLITLDYLIRLALFLSFRAHVSRS